MAGVMEGAAAAAAATCRSSPSFSSFSSLPLSENKSALLFQFPKFGFQNRQHQLSAAANLKLGFPKNPNFQINRSFKVCSATTDAPVETRPSRPKVVFFRKKDIASIEVVLEDRNGLIWRELNTLREVLSSSMKSSSTIDVMLRIMQFLLIHQRSLIYKDAQSIYNDWAVDKLLEECSLREEEDIGGQWWRRWIPKWGKSSHIYLRVFAGLDEDIMEDVMDKAYLEQPNQYFFDHTIKFIKGTADNFGVDKFASSMEADNFVAYMLVMGYVQPKVVLYASNKENFNESRPSMTFTALPS